MQKALITKEIVINAPAEDVWHVVTDSAPLNTWLQELIPGSKAEGQVVQGGEVKFILDAEGNGYSGTYTEVTPLKKYRLEFTTQLTEGQPQEEPDADSLVGSWESYELVSEGEGTKLLLQTELPGHVDVEAFATGWGKALEKIKQLAESPQI